MTFYHCWECMAEVTPSRRRVAVQWDAGHVIWVPMSTAEMNALCAIRRNGGPLPR